jgi:hypothetical protein
LPTPSHNPGVKSAGVFRPFLDRLTARPPFRRPPRVELRDLLEAALRGLSDRDREVVKARLGFVGDGTPQTLAALGQRLGVSRERVRQIQARGLRRMRTQVPARALRRAAAAVRAEGGVASTSAVARRLGLPDGLARLALALCSPAVVAEGADVWRLASVRQGLVRRVHAVACELLGRFPEGVPLAKVLASVGVRANRVTLAACLRLAPDLTLEADTVRWKDPAEQSVRRREVLREIFGGRGGAR